MHDHSALIKALEAHATDEASLKKLSDLFKVFGDMTRIRILYALSSGEMCVCALSDSHVHSIITQGYEHVTEQDK